MADKSEVVRHLEYAKQLIRNEQKWTGDNNFIGGRYCACTAIAAATVHFESYQPPYNRVATRCVDALRIVSERMGYGGVVILNNNSDHSTVLTMFDLTILFVRNGIVRV